MGDEVAWVSGAHTYITLYAPPAHQICTVTEGKKRRNSKAQVRKVPTVGLMELERNCCNLLKIDGSGGEDRTPDLGIMRPSLCH